MEIMEKIINEVANIKKEVIGYLKDVAEQNKLSYLFTYQVDTIKEYRFENDNKIVDTIKEYHFEIDNKIYVHEDIEKVLNKYPLENLLVFMKKVKEDVWKIDNRVMWADNGHNDYLVNLINECWQKKRVEFVIILQALMLKYELECFDKVPHINIDNIDEIEKYATELLTHICDDKDLECIIAFCRL